MSKKKSAEVSAETEADGSPAFRMQDGAVINFATDAEGNAYGPENSPKKGDKTKERWALYRDGMTVSEALEAGLTRSNIRRDRRANFITITNPPEAPAEASDAAEADAEAA